MRNTRAAPRLTAASRTIPSTSGWSSGSISKMRKLNEIARITKTFEGVAKTLFTTADNYVVQIHTRLPQPLNALVVASALSVDTALKQDNRGLG